MKTKIQLAAFDQLPLRQGGAHARQCPTSPPLRAIHAWRKAIGAQHTPTAARTWGTKKIASVLFTVLAVLLWVASPSAVAGELIYSQYSDGQSAFGPSLVWPATGKNSEIADEFDVVANIDGVYARGFAGVGTVNYQGVWIRFYAFGADNKPGALQHEYFLAASDPNVVFNGGEIDATLSPAFAATGRHFLSVQPVINYWYSWSSSSGAPRGEAFYFRNNTAGEAWHHGDGFNTNVNADVEFSLYGTVTGAGTITSLSANTLPRSGFLEIFGTNFGGNGTVLIGGIAAPGADLDQHPHYRLRAGKCAARDASGASGQ